MSTPPSDAGIQANPEHGTVRSYVIGFVLSLIFTFIPYLLVVNQVITGTALLAAIFGFAIAQLIVQVVFFLHLGRGPKPNWNLYFFISTVGIILVVVGGSIFIINNLVYNMLPSDQAKRLIEGEGIVQIEGTKTGACQGQHETHKVTITDNKISPQYTYAKECDTLIFINDADSTPELFFGEPPERNVYAGVDKLDITKRRNKALTLSETGHYQFYDSKNKDLTGFFIVSEQ